MESGEVKKKVLLLPKWYPNRMVPLNGNFIENHAMAINKCCDVAVLFVQSENRNNGGEYDIQLSNEHNFPVIRVYFRKKNGLLKILTPYYYFKAQQLGYREILNTFGRPDLCHVHVMARSGLLALYLRQKYNIDFLITEHWTGYVIKKIGLFKKIFTRYLMRKSRGISTVTEYLAVNMRKKGLEAWYEIIPNAIDTAAFLPAPEMTKSNSILHISDIKDGHKNISGLLKAVQLLLAKRNDFSVTIVGEGPDRPMLMQMTKDLGLEKYVTFTGELEGKDLIASIRQCSFLSLFSNYETFGVVLIEALSCGKPVIASKLPPIQEFITEEQGILVSPGNTEEMSAALNRMLDSYSNYEPQKLHDYVNGLFSFETVGRQFCNWYEACSIK